MNDYVPLRVRAKLLLKAMLPSGIFEWVRSLWIRLFSRFIGDRTTVARYQERFLAEFPAVVQAGPFKGMQYVDVAIGSSYLHKLVGSYEAILHPFIERIRDRDFDTVIDIGSAEGYYIVGFGMTYPDAHLIGFELEEVGRNLNTELYAKNGLTNKMTLLEEATAENVAALVTPKTLLICDCEGGEVDILDPERYPAIAGFDTAIIELHDFIRPGAREAMIERFGATHDIESVRFRLADPEAFPFLASVTDQKDLYELRRERAWQEQEWLLLTRKETR